MEATPSVAISLRGLRKQFGHGDSAVVAVDGVDLDVDGRGVPHAARSLGLGQDDRPAHDRRVRAAHRGHDRAGRPGRDAHARPFDRDVNTVFQDYALFPSHDRRRRTSSTGCAWRKVPSAAAPRASPRRWRPSGSRATADRKPTPALRRTAPAGRPGPCPGQPAQGAAARRAARRPGPQAARADAGRAQGHPARGRHHLRLRHARPGGGADDERPHRRVQRGPHRAGRHAPRRSTSGRATRFVAGFVGTSNLLRGATPSAVSWAGTAIFSVRPEKIYLADPDEPLGGGEHSAAGHRRARSSTSAAATRYVVDLEPGGSLIALRAEPDDRPPWTPGQCAAAACTLRWRRRERVPGSTPTAPIPPAPSRPHNDAASRGHHNRRRDTSAQHADSSAIVAGAQRWSACSPQLPVAATSIVGRRSELPRRRPPTRDLSAQGEGALNVLAWPGYVEDGSTTRTSTGSPRSRSRPAAR